MKSNANTTYLECKNLTYYQVPGGPISEFLAWYIFPVVCFIGICGTILNLIVLNSRGMKTKTNCFLSAMAVADFCFFGIMLVTNLISYETFSHSEMFVELFFATKMPFNALSNCLSSSSIWFAVMLTLERLIAIRTPLHAHLFWRKYKPAYVISFICVVSFLLQIYNLFFFVQMKYPNCLDGTKFVTLMKIIEPKDNYYFYYFVKYSVIIVPMFSVTLPVLLLVMCNIMLLYYLRLSRRELQNLRKTKNMSANKEWKVTTTVLTIVLTLVIFNLPSVIYFWISNFTVYRSRTLVLLSNFIILVSKALNFLLYCTISSNFRRRLCKIFVSNAKGRMKLTRRSCDSRIILTYKPSITVPKNNYDAVKFDEPALLPCEHPLFAYDNEYDDVAV